MIQLDKFGYVVNKFVSTVKTPSPGVEYLGNVNIITFNLNKEDLFEFHIQDFLDILGVYHDKKICALIRYNMEIYSIVEFKKKGMFLSKTKVWNKNTFAYFVSKDEKHCKYMAKMFTYYVAHNDSPPLLFHVKMGLGLGYSKPAIINFLNRIS